MTIDGLIAGIIISIFSGIPIGLMYSTTFQKRWSKIVGVVVCMIIFFCIAGFGFTSQELIFNNGTCPQCGTKYEAVAHKNADT